MAQAGEVQVERLEPPKLAQDIKQERPVSKVERGTCYWYGKIKGSFVVKPIHRVGMVKQVCRRQTDLKRGRPAYASGKHTASEMKEIYFAGKG